MKTTIYLSGSHPEMGEQDLIITADVCGGYTPATHWEPAEGPDVELPEFVTVDGGKHDGARISIKCVDANEDDLVELVLEEYVEQLRDGR